MSYLWTCYLFLFCMTIRSIETNIIFFILRYFGSNRNYSALDLLVRANYRDMINVNYLLIGSYSDGYRCRYETDIDTKIYDK